MKIEIKEAGGVTHTINLEGWNPRAKEVTIDGILFMPFDRFDMKGTKPTSDFRSLLKRYIAHVIDCEGSDYFSYRDHPFTQEELSILKQLSEEI